MITEQEYFDALEIVRAYMEQLKNYYNNLMSENLSRRFDQTYSDVKKGDFIRMISVGRKPVNLEIGEQYRVIHCRLTSLRHRFQEKLKEKYGVERYRDIPEEIITKETLSVPHRCDIKVFLRTKKYVSFNAANSDVKFEVVSSK